MTGKAHERGKRAAWELAGRKPRSEDEEILSLPQVSAWRWNLRPLGAPGASLTAEVSQVCGHGKERCLAFSPNK